MTATKTSGANQLMRWAGLGLLISSATWAAFNRDQLAAIDLEAWVAGLGWAGPVAFVAAYALATLLFLPGSLLTLAGGAVFGLGWGTFYNLTGATIGAGLSFLVARGLLGAWVESKTQGRLAQLKAGVEREGWSFVAFVRLVPLFPFNLLNYALGLTRVGFWPYLITSYLAMLPGAFVYTYLGALGKEALAGQAGLAQLGPKALLALGGMALVVYLPKLYFKRQKAQATLIDVDQLHQRLSEAEWLLLDLRDTADVESKGKIEQATNIPWGDLPGSLERLLPWKDKPVALICTTSIRSQKARQLLQEQGFNSLRVVDGGMNAWVARGYELER